MRLIACSLLVCTAACLPTPAPRPELVDRDFAADGVSPTPTLHLTFSGAVIEDRLPDRVVLVRGDPSPTLERAVDGADFSAADRVRLIAMTVSAAGSTISAVPNVPLAPHASYTLLIGPGLLIDGAPMGTRMELPFVTGGDELSAPTLALFAPRDGEVAVPRNLRSVSLRVSKPVLWLSAIGLVGEDGRSVPVRVSAPTEECATCVRLDLSDELAAATHYHLQAAPDVVDDTGQPVFGSAPGFTTGMESRTEPLLLDGLTVNSGDGCLVARFATAEPSWGALCQGASCAMDGPVGAHEIAFLVSPPTLGPLSIEVEAWDETTGPEGTIALTVESPSGETLSITEILSEPLGSRVAEQFVELYNWGGAPIDLAGFSLHDPWSNVVLPSVWVLPGQYALIVPESYATAGPDPAPPPESVLVRLSVGHLGKQGLSKAGDPVWVNDPMGRTVTRFGGYSYPIVRGQSIRRNQPLSCDLESAFGPTPSGTSTPGAP